VLCVPAGRCAGGFAFVRAANLYRADLVGANLSFAFVLNSDLVEADLAGANLRDAHLLGADLTGANLTGAVYDEFTVFPSGSGIYDGSWGLPGDATPSALGMVPAPEPSAGLMLTFGSLALAAVGRGGSGRWRIGSMRARSTTARGRARRCTA
jgi:hypothetical protein